MIDSKLLKDGENANDYLEVDDENEVLVLTSDQTTMLVRKLGVVPAKSMQELEEHIEW